MGEDGPVSGWTVDTSHTHLLSLIQAAQKQNETQYNALKDLTVTGLANQKENVANALIPVEKALVQARLENDKRFDDLRDTADKRFDDMHLQAESRDKSMSDKLETLSSLVATSQAANAAIVLSSRERRSSSSVLAAWIGAIVAALVGIAVAAAEIRIATKP